jgi:phosphopantothenate synthetase
MDLKYEPLKKDIKDITTYEVGDVLVSSESGERTVLAVCGRLVFLSNVNDLTRTAFGSIYTVEDVERSGRTFKSQPQEPTLTEVTLEEIAKLKGIPVEQLRIKE